MKLAPVAPSADVADCGFTHAQAPRPFEVSDATSGGSNFSNLSGGKLCAWASLAAKVFPAFGESVSHVFSIGPKKQMGRVAARGIVAAMQDVELSRFTNREPVGASRSGLRALSVPELSVALRASERLPRPAFIRPAHVYPRPKPSLQHGSAT